MPDGGKLEEILRLTKENNQMLRAMRRNAWIHSVIKFAVYGALAFGFVWFYLHFIAPILLQMLDVLNKIQGAGNQAQGQLSGLMDTIKGLTQWIPGASSTSTH